MKMNCGKIISVAISFLKNKNASLPGLIRITTKMKELIANSL